MIFLNKNEQEIYDFWKDSTLDYFDGWDVPAERSIPQTYEDTIALMRESYIDDIPEMLEHYPEIKKIVQRYFESVDLEKVAEKICYEYIPQQRRIRIKRR